jgi:hypothetical protein
MDAVAILDSLDADAIADRLDRMERDRQALLTLLRAARARERGRDRRPGEGRQDDQDATHTPAG